MRVLLVSTPWVSVPPRAYGGTETVLDHLARAIVESGHEVLLWATGDSTCPVPVAWLYQEPVSPMGLIAAEAAHVLAAYERARDFDVVHDHTLLGPLLADRHVPLVATAHNPFTPETESIYRHASRWARIAAISSHQSSQAGDVPIARVIHHGIHVDEFPLGGGAGGYLLFLGRMTPDKGVREAVEVARGAGLPLLIAAKMRQPEEVEYFREQIEPVLDGSMTYLGEVAHEERLNLLAGAMGLIFPISWPEPFGLVVIEALACGTPVLAYPRGAAREIVDDGKTGFLCGSRAEMVSAARRLGEIDRAGCRKAAEERFSAERMARQYVELYRETAVRHRGRSLRPIAARRRGFTSRASASKTQVGA